MALVEEVVRDILASLATDAGAPAAARWIDNRYREFCTKAKPRHLRKFGELAIPGVYDTGTLTTTRDSTTVTGVGTAWQTNIGSGTQEYWYIRPSSAWYQIASVGGELAITLTTAFSEDAVAAGSYKAVKRHHPLDSNARWLGMMYLTRLRARLDLISLDEMNVRYPGRRLTNHWPFAACQVGADTSGNLMVEVYPPPDESEIIHYVYWDIPTALAIGSTIPPQIDAFVLKEGALIDAYRFEKSKALRAGNVEVAAVWRNDEKAQETKWKQVIQDAAATDRGVDDETFILQSAGSRYSQRPDQRTAHDYVYDNWSWPSYV